VAFGKDEESTKEAVKKVNEEKIPKYIGLLEAFLQKNGGKYLVGNRVSNFIQNRNELLTYSIIYRHNNI